MAFGVAVLTLVAFVVAGRMALRSDSIPYNVRELTDDYPGLVLGTLGLGLMGCGGLTLWLASLAQRRPREFARFFVPVVAVASSMLFLGLWLVAPTESMDDVVGTPRLGILPAVERWVRFMGLLAGPLAGITLGGRLARGAFRPRSETRVLGLILGVLAVSWVIVVPLAITSNIVELLRDRGRSVFVVGLVGYFVVLGIAVELLAERIAFGSARLTSWLVVLLSVPIAWLCLTGALNPRLEKYEQTFSALQFLLSPDRTHYLDAQSIFVRFVAVQCGLTWLLASGASMVLALEVTSAVPPDTPPRADP